MNLIFSAIRALEMHKDAIVAVAALISPFAAVFVGLRASKRQAAANLQAAKIQSESARSNANLQIEAQTEIAKIQIRATVGTAYRQKLIDKIRDTLADELLCVWQTIDAMQGTNELARTDLRDATKRSAANRARLNLLLSSEDKTTRDIIDVFEAILASFQAHDSGEPLSKELAATLAGQLEELVRGSQNVLRFETQRIAVD
ncbi:MAG: hypothetical protein QOK24_749 [Verrucomicrobiota bacterium]|jgi:hypothetical protein